MKYISILLSLLFIAAMVVSSCLAQIHFSPDWQPGKRSAMGTQSQFSENPYINDVVEGSSKGSRNELDSDTILSLLGLHKQRDIQTCAEQVDYKVLINVAKILANEAKRISSCMKSCWSRALKKQSFTWLAYRFLWVAGYNCYTEFRAIIRGAESRFLFVCSCFVFQFKNVPIMLSLRVSTQTFYTCVFFF